MWQQSSPGRQIIEIAMQHKMPIDPRGRESKSMICYRMNQGHPAVSSNSELSTIAFGDRPRRDLKRWDSIEELRQAKKRRLIKEEEVAGKQAELEAKKIARFELAHAFWRAPEMPKLR